ncbi:MAG: AraC family transcriptional regulator [Lachnospiraceae bacterium]|nr:AraC family transcriptional regulator [Lachnospiraceae bacterium]
MTDQNIPVKGYLNEDYRVFHNSDSLGTDVGVHLHTFFKLTLVKEGKGTYMIDGNIYNIRPYDVILVPRHVPHKPGFAAGEMYDRYIFYMSSDMLGSFDSDDQILSDIFSGSASPVLHLNKKTAAPILSAADAVYKESRSDAYASSLSARLGTIRLLIEIERCRKNADPATPSRNSENEKMLRILHYINENISEALPISLLSEQFFISRYHLMRLFKETFGFSIHEYITERRLLLADEQLRSGKEPVKVCYDCGFGSYSAFARAYRTRFGISPGKAGNSSISKDLFTVSLSE